MSIVIGIDAHKNTHTAVAVDEATGRHIEQITVRARTTGHERLVCGPVIWMLFVVLLSRIAATFPVAWSVT
ncbi:MAG: hypothetical protein ABR548_08230 [Actinomycetota bacterium]|nr:hypothetical protein [Actinomycetota bacterium]